MPSVSQAQSRYFGGIKGGAIPRPKGMSAKTVDDFATGPRKGLPEHMADGGVDPVSAAGKASQPYMADGGVAWEQREGVAPGNGKWIELVRAGSIPQKSIPDHSMSGGAPGLDGQEHTRENMTNTAFQQREQSSPKASDWQEHLANGRGVTGDVKHMADGGKVDKWAARAFSGNKGGLHRATGTPEGKTIPAYRVKKIATSGTPHEKEMAQAAINIKPGRYGR